MSRSSRLRRWFTLSTSPTARRGTCRFHPGVELLEHRVVMSTLSVNGSVLTYTAGAGENNQVTITAAPSGTDTLYTITDSGATLSSFTWTAGYKWYNVNFVPSVDAQLIPSHPFSALQIDLGDGTDTLTVNSFQVASPTGTKLVLSKSGSGSAAITLKNPSQLQNAVYVNGPSNGSAGVGLTLDDSSALSGQAWTLSGTKASGADPNTSVNFGALSALTVLGSAGSDFTVLDIPAPTTLLTGSSSRVTVRAATSALTIDRQGGGTSDSVLNAMGFSNSAALDGGAGNDSLVGGPGNDVLIGGPGMNMLPGRRQERHRGPRQHDRFDRRPRRRGHPDGRSRHRLVLRPGRRRDHRGGHPQDARPLEAVRMHKAGASTKAACRRCLVWNPGRHAAPSGITDGRPKSVSQ
jgi:Ca2+-binding RTX toxin-like protein